MSPLAIGDTTRSDLQELTGLDVGEGQACILLGDVHAYQAQLCREAGHDVDEPTAARLWVMEVLTPYEQLAHDVIAQHGHRDSGVLRPAGGAVAAERAGRPRRRHEQSARGVGRRRHPYRFRSEDGDRRRADGAVRGAARRTSLIVEPAV